MKHPNPKHHKLGFTMAELLAVLAILLILIGLGVPGFIGLRRTIKIAEYDDIAREIYVSAQNQLTRLAANGMEGEIQKQLTEGAAWSAAQPADYDAAAGGLWDSANYRHAGQDDAVRMALLLPLGGVSDDLRTNGFYVIEYNVKTCTVYGVFYAEKSFNYGEVSVKENFRTSREVRKKDMVGYYGGSAVQRDPHTYLDPPKLNIINENKLILEILNCPEGATPVVEISDGETKVEVQPTSVEGTGSKRTVLLDSLENGKHFHEMFGTLIPGKDLTITVTYEKPGAISSSASIGTNSLFATREPNAAGVPGAPGDTVTIAWARHLQNLETSVSHLDDPAITIARQTNHIEWKTEFGDGYFVSIRNAGANANFKRYEGRGYEIRELSGRNGLFAAANGMELDGINIVNPRINAVNDAGNDPVGVLAGTAGKDGEKSTTISNCGVYYRVLNEEDTVNYNAYAQASGYGVNNPFAGATGGLVGQASEATISNSFAALPFISAQKGGTLIGSAANCTITNCYANCDNLPAGATVAQPGAEFKAEFAYFLNGSGNTITGCYAVGNAANGGEGLFAPEAVSGIKNTIGNCYYAVSHCEWAGGTKSDLGATEFYYRTPGADGAPDTWTATSQAELEKAGTDKHLPGQTESWGTMIPQYTHPYREYLDGRAYPYPALTMDHYGSWPDEDGTVQLKITMRQLGDDITYAIFAGRVVVTDPSKTGDESVLFDSEKHLTADGKFDGLDSVNITPGTHIKIEITPKSGYKYVSTGILGDNFPAGPKPEDNKPYTVEYTVKKNTEAVVNFQQNTYKLTCSKPIDGESGKEISGATYAADCPKYLTIEPPDSGMVETGSKVTLRFAGAPAGYPANSQVVWYTIDGDPEKHDVPRDANGQYTFTMPDADTTLHVMYSKDTFTLNVEYYVEDAESGEYPAEPNKTTTLSYAVGTLIDQKLIQVLADSSNLTLTLEDQNVLYLASAVVNRDIATGTETVFKSTSDDQGQVTYDPPEQKQYLTTETDISETFNAKIYIDRKTYELKLVKGENITEVSFGGDQAGVTQDENSVTKTFRYGQKVEAQAEVIPGQVFTVWQSNDSRFRMSSAAHYSFTMPHYPLTLTATADKDMQLVTLNLKENDESWLASSDSRRADPITITLVSSKDNKECPLTCLTEEKDSFVAQAVLPAVPELGHGYYIRVNYKSGQQITCTDDNGAPLLLTVRDREVVSDLNFYTVTYHPNCQVYTGSVPKGGTYPKNYELAVSGNTGMLRRTDDVNKNILQGWRAVYAGVQGGDTVYGSGDKLKVQYRTDLFAEWVSEIRVYYKADDATGGMIPVDAAAYINGSIVTVKAGVPTKAGYTFAGWQKSGDTDPDRRYYATDTFTIDTENVTLTATWQREEYTLTYLERADSEWQPVVGMTGAVVSSLHYGETLTAADWKGQAPQGTTFLGWAVTEVGEVRYRAGDTITITGNMNLYARFAGDQVTVTYYSADEKTEYCSQQFGNGIAAYLAPNGESVPQVVTAWSTAPDGKGVLYLCQDGANYSLNPATFTADTRLYAVTGKVYNYELQTWYDTLGAAVDAASNENTLIVYRNTEEPHNIWFGRADLYILANGNRTVKWPDDATAIEDNGDEHLLKEERAGELLGCMGVGAHTVTFGKSNVTGLSMEGNSLTFDANQQSRVISLSDKSTLNMYDGVTLTNGLRPKINWGEDPSGAGTTIQWDSTYINGKAWSEEINAQAPNRRSYLGGGVYAASGSQFNMYGGTISHCSAYIGGGVYLYTGSKMQMGNMEQPKYYSSTAIYYEPTWDETSKKFEYTSVPPEQVTPENFKNYYVTTGNPQICYNNSTRDFVDTDEKSRFSCSDGGGGLMMLDLEDGNLILYRGSINNNKTAANGGGILTDGGPAEDGAANRARLRIYEVDISHNEADGYGGGILQWQGVLYVYNSTIRQNSAKRDGGGIYLHHFGTEQSNIQFYYGDISANRADRNGGGIYVETGPADQGLNGGLKMWVRGGNLTNNVANANGTNSDASGGGVYVAGNNAYLFLQAGSIRDNKTNTKGEQDRLISRPNDVYLNENSSAMTILDGGMRMTQNPGEKIHVDCAQPQGGRLIVKYENGDDFKVADTDYFKYDPAAQSDLYIVPDTTNRQLILSEDQGTERTVTFRANYEGGTGEDVTETVPIGGAVAYPQIIRQGYDLIGWARTPNAVIEDYLVYRIGGVWHTKYENGTWSNPLAGDVQPDYTVTGDYNQQLYAMWKPYTVTYHLNTTNTTVHIAEEESVGPKVTIISPDNTYTEGEITYTFVGWSKSENDQTVEYKEHDVVELTSSIHLYAVWQPDKVRVTYDFSPGTDNDQNSSRNIFANWNSDMEILSLEKEISYVDNILKGWSTVKTPTDTDRIYLAGDMVPAEQVQHDFTLYAVWAPTVKVTFDWNMGPEQRSTEQNVEKDKPFTFTVTGTVPTREDYIFKGWATANDAAAPTYVILPDGTITIDALDEDTTLYAVWASAVTVTFESDGQESVTKIVEKGQSFEHPNPTKEGYTFKGWAKEPDATTADYPVVEDSNSITIPLTDETATSLTLHAVWTQNTDPSGGTDSSNPEQAAPAPNAVITAPEASTAPQPTNQAVPAPPDAATAPQPADPAADPNAASDPEQPVEPAASDPAQPADPQEPAPEAQDPQPDQPAPVAALPDALPPQPEQGTPGDSPDPDNPDDPDSPE